MEAARPAAATDLDRLVALYELAAQELRPQRGGELWWWRHRRTDPRSSLAADLEDPDRLVVAGTIDDTVIGFAVVAVEPLADGRNLGVVSDLFVEPDARAVGVGEEMIGCVIDWCRQRSCVGIDGLALPGARATKNFFETFGFTARAIVVHRDLGDGTGPAGEGP